MGKEVKELVEKVCIMVVSRSRCPECNVPKGRTHEDYCNSAKLVKAMGMIGIKDE